VALLEFAHGPALTFALAVFLLGTLWRLVAIFLLPWRRIPSPAREGAPPALLAALQAVFAKMLPHRAFMNGAGYFTLVNGYVFHIGLAVVVFGFAPHIQFINSLFSVSWPELPSGLVYAVGVLTAASLLAALVRRMTSPVLRLISRADDYVSWLMTFLPVITGLLAVSDLGARYEALFSIHILSVCAFLIWFPFGRLMHAFLFVVSRGATGVRFCRRGAIV
jgi:nitrate reductase gamma subunit